MPDIIQSVRGPRGILARLSDERLNARLEDAVEETRQLVYDSIYERMPDDSGALRSALSVRVDEAESGRVRLVAEIDESVAPYAKFVDEGTGIYGPTGQPITPEVGTFMTFFWRRLGQKSVHGAGGTPVNLTMWMKEVQGQQGQHFMRLGWRAAMAKARRIFADHLERL